MNLLFSGNIPMGAGLSSSSAMVVAAAVAINDFNELGIDKLALAELLAAGEKYVGTEGGGMDQTTSLSGKKGMALKIDFFPIRVEYISFPEDYLVVVCNSLVDAKKSSGANLAYNQRVVECRLAVAMVKKLIRDKYNVESDIRLLGDLKKSEFSHMLNNIDGMLDEIFIKEELSFAEISSFLELDEKIIRQRYLELKDGSLFFVCAACAIITRAMTTACTMDSSTSGGPSSNAGAATAAVHGTAGDQTPAASSGLYVLSWSRSLLPHVPNLQHPYGPIFAEDIHLRPADGCKDDLSRHSAGESGHRAKHQGKGVSATWRWLATCDESSQ